MPRKEMFDFNNKDVLVLGLDARGRAACDYLRRCGARVSALSETNTPELEQSAAELRASGVEVVLGAAEPPSRPFALGVVSPVVRAESPLLRSLAERQTPLLGELELGFQQAKCLSIAIGGTNGKSTTAGLVERILASNHRQVLVCGHGARPLSSAIEQTRELDFLILQVQASQLERTQFFRPAVAVLLNLAPGHRGGYHSAEAYAAACSRLLRQQQVFDWAILQSEALACLRKLELPVPGKVISFSATDPKADLYLDRGLLISRVPGWSGPLLDMDHCQLRGPHHAENLMAALAVGHVLRLPLESMVEPLKGFSAGPHRGQVVAEVNGIQFINDSKARNVDALHKALLAARLSPSNQPNVWLIAGGRDPGLDFHYLGPVLSKRVKGAFLLGEAAEKLRAAWSLFTPCTLAASLVEAVTEAARNAVSGDVVLLSPACSSLDQFRNYQERGESFCRTVKSISWGAPSGHPKIDDKNRKP